MLIPDTPFINIWKISNHPFYYEHFWLASVCNDSFESRVALVFQLDLMFYEVASVGKALGLPVTVVVPKTTTQLMIDRIKNENAEVIVHGENWNEADARVQDMIKANSK